MILKANIHEYLYTVKLLDVIGGKEEVKKTLLDEIEFRVRREIEEVICSSVFDTTIEKEDGEFVMYAFQGDVCVKVYLDTLEVVEG